MKLDFFHRFKFGRQSSTSMDEASIALPVELWNNIFNFLASSSEDLKSLTLTCSIFRYLSQPFLFESVTLRPHYSSSPERSRKNATNARLLQQLAFFQSPYILPSIKRCKVLPDTGSRRSADSSSLRHADTPIIDTILDALLSFPNLTDISFHLICFSAARLEVLRQLSIHSMSLHSCFMSPATTSTPLNLPLQSVTITNHGDRDPNAHFMSLFLHPGHLKRLVAVPSVDIMSSIASCEHPLAALTKLELSVESVGSADFATGLASCRSLTSLSILPQTWDTRVLPLPTLPKVPPFALSHYYGPAPYIPALCRNTALVSLGISVLASAEELVVSFKSLGKCTSLKSLLIQSHTFPLPLLTEIHHRFPSLLDLQIRGPNNSPSAWLSIFQNVSRQSHLRSLYIPVQVTDPMDLWKPPVYQINDTLKFFAQLYPDLLRVYPSLQRALVTYGADERSGGKMGMSWERPVHSQSTMREGPSWNELSVEVNTADGVGQGRSLTSSETKLLRLKGSGRHGTRSLN